MKVCNVSVAYEVEVHGVMHFEASSVQRSIRYAG